MERDFRVSDDPDSGGPPDLLTVDEAAAVLRIGRTAAYELARRPDGDGLPTVRVGRQLRVPRVRLEELVGAPITWPIPRAPRHAPSVPEPPVPIPSKARRTTRRPGTDPQLFSA